MEEQKTEKSMEIKGTMASTGLGCIGWWTSEEEDEEAVEDEQDEQEGVAEAV